MPELDKYRKNACQKLELIISYLGVTAKVSSADNPGKKLKLKVESEDAGRIIGRRGRTLASIQLLLNSAMHQSDEPMPEIVIEIEGYDRHKRDEEGKGRRNSKRDRGDRKRGNRNDNSEKDGDRDGDDRKKSRRRNNQKADETRNEDSRRSKPKERVSKEDAEYFVDPDEIKVPTESEEPAADAPVASDKVEVSTEAPAKVETTTETPAEPTSEAAPETKAEAAPEAKAEPAPEQATEPAPEAKAETAPEQTAEPASQPKGEQLPDNVVQCRQKALDAAKEVRRWGEEITLRGMTGEERQAIKDAFKDDPLIDVVEGEVTGPDKRKVIICERATEKA